MQYFFLEIGLSHYLFLGYIFLLVCAITILCKFLFSDVKRQNKLLDEKETKLLKLYSTLEDAMDEFYDNVESSKGEINLTLQKIREELRTGAVLAPASDEPESAPAPDEKKRARKASKKPAAESASASFESMLRDAEGETPVTYSRNDSILNLHEEGLPPVDIAKELGITRTEVDLVIGMNKKNDGDQ